MLLIFAFLSFYLPNSDSVPSKVYILWFYLSLFVSVCAVGMYLFNTIRFKKKVKINYVIMALFYTYMYGFTSFFSDYANFETYKCIYFVGFITLLEFAVEYFKEKEVITAYLKAGIIATLIYGLSYIKYFNVVGGMHHGQRKRLSYGYVITEQNWYFFTYDNASVFIFLPIAAVFVYYCIRFDKSKFKLCLLYEIMVFLMYLLKSAATAEAIFLLFIIASTYYFYKLSKNEKIKFDLDYKKTWLLIIVVFLLVLTIVGSDLAYTVAGFFGKDGSFTGRDAIWNRAKELIAQSPIFGYGMEDVFFKTMRLIYSHCHNILLEILYDGGIVGLSLYAAMIIFFAPKNNPVSCIFNICLFCYLFGQCFETQLAFPYFLSILYFNYHYCGKKVSRHKFRFILSSFLSKSFVSIDKTYTRFIEYTRQ